MTAVKRFWRWLKFAILGLLGAVGVALIWLAVANAAADSKVEKKLAELRDAGEPVSLVDLAQKPIPPEINAATYLRRAKSDVEVIQKEVYAACEAGPKADVDTLDEGRLSPALQTAIRSAFAQYPNAVPLLEQASNCPYYDPQLNFNTDTNSFLENLLERVQYTRNVYRVLNFQTLLLLAEHKQEEPLRTCLTMFRLARHFDRDPTTINFLVCLAIRGVAIDATNLVLRSAPLPDSAHHALQAELARHDVAQAFQQALRTERAFGLQKIDESWHLAGCKLPWSKNLQSTYLDVLDTGIQIATRPYWDAAAGADMATVDKSFGVLDMLLPAIRSTKEAGTRMQAKIRCLRILAALERREQSLVTGEPKLAELGLPADVLIDPYNGKPLQLKQTPDGWVIYSVGKNLKDDGGKLDDDQTDVGLGPVSTVASETQSETE